MYFSLGATCSYTLNMASTGIRELKNKLSHYIRQIEAVKRVAVKRVAVTARGSTLAPIV